jgi:putative tryptophan/tyrosine transport system substrate-binding protein
VRQLQIADCRFSIGTTALLVLALALSLVGASLSVEAQKPPVVGVLITDARNNISLPILVEGLRDLGYVDGKNIALEIRSADGKPDALPALAAELVQRKVDVLYATGPAAIRAARDTTTVIPIVALDLESDPVQAGWARNIARPGGNITGLFLDLADLAGKWVQLLREAAPGIRRVGLVWDSTTGPAQLIAAKAAAQRFAIELQVMEVRSGDDLDAAFRGGASAGSRAVVFLSSPLISTGSRQLAEFVVKNRLPAISPFRRFADAGGLMSYGPDFDDFRRRAASYVDRILKGAKPGDLPIERPAKYELVINSKTAKALGLTVPPYLLLRADEVIQ